MAVGAYESVNALNKDLTGGQKFMKIVILGLNIVYLIFGIVLCALAGAALAGYAASIAGSTLPTGLIVIGVFLIVTAIIGGLSAWFEFRVGLAFYFGAMLIWTIILLAIGIAVLAEKNNLTTILASGWSYADGGTQNTVQNNFQCCGRYGQISDWYSFGNQGWDKNKDTFGSTTLFTNPSNAVASATLNAKFATFPSITTGGGCPGPFSELDLDMNSNKTCVGGATVYTSTVGTWCYSQAQGCVYALQSSLQSNWQAAGGCGIAFAVLMAVGLAFTALLIKGIAAKSQNAAIERNRLKTAKDVEEKRRRGKGGLKIPDNVL